MVLFAVYIAMVNFIYCLSMKMEQESQFLLKCSNLTERALLSWNLAFSTTGFAMGIMVYLFYAHLIICSLQASATIMLTRWIIQ